MWLTSEIFPISWPNVDVQCVSFYSGFSRFYRTLKLNNFIFVDFQTQVSIWFLISMTFCTSRIINKKWGTLLILENTKFKFDMTFTIQQGSCWKDRVRVEFAFTRVTINVIAQNDPAWRSNNFCLIMQIF